MFKCFVLFSKPWPWLWLLSKNTLSHFNIPESGCSYQAKDGSFPDSRIAACRGKWYGHIKHGGDLCASGWDVCNWNTDSQVLRKISWDVAMSVDGCYAYNAAQDGGRCRECREQLDQVLAVLWFLQNISFIKQF